MAHDTIPPFPRAAGRFLLNEANLWLHGLSLTGTQSTLLHTMWIRNEARRDKRTARDI